MTHRRLTTATVLALVALLLAAGIAGCGGTSSSGSAGPSNGAFTSEETTYLTDLAAAETQAGQALQSLATLSGPPLSQTDRAKLKAADAQLTEALSTWSKRAVPSQRLQAVHTYWMAALQAYTNGVNKITRMAESGTKDTAALKSALKQIALGQKAMKQMLVQLDKLSPSASPTP